MGKKERNGTGQEAEPGTEEMQDRLHTVEGEQHEESVDGPDDYDWLSTSLTKPQSEGNARPPAEEGVKGQGAEGILGKVPIAPQWQKMSPERAVECLRKGVVEDAAGSFMKHVLFCGGVRYASFEALLEEEGYGDVREQLDAAAMEVLHAHVAKEVQELDQIAGNLCEQVLERQVLGAYAADVGGAVVVLECYIQVLVDEAEYFKAFGELLFGAFRRVRFALQKEEAVRESAEWLNGAELRMFAQCQSTKGNLHRCMKVFEAASKERGNDRKLRRIVEQMDSAFEMHTQTLGHLGGVLKAVLRLPEKEQSLEEEQAKSASVLKLTDPCNRCGYRLLDPDHAQSASLRLALINKEEPGLRNLLTHDFVLDAYILRGIIDPLLGTTDKQPLILDIESIPGMLPSIEAIPQSERAQLLNDLRPWVWQSYSHALVTSYSESAFEKTLSFLDKDENETFATPLNVLAVSLLVQRVVQLSVARKQLSKGGIDRFNEYIEGVVKEASARDQLLCIFFREVDQNYKYYSSLAQVRSAFFFAQRDKKCAKSNLRGFLGAIKESLSQCERALEFRERVLARAPPGGAEWLRVSFGRLEFEVREQRRLVRTLQGWLKRTGGDSSKVQSVDISNIHKGSLLESVREHIIEPRGSDASLEHLLTVALEQKVVDPQWTHQWFRPLLQEGTQTVVEDVVLVCRSACWDDGPTNLPQVNGFLLESKIVIACARKVAQKLLDDDFLSHDFEQLLVKTLEEEVLDARKLFLHLSPLLEDLTEQFLRDLWESFPRASWKDSPDGSPLKAPPLSKEASRNAEEKTKGSQSKVESQVESSPEEIQLPLGDDGVSSEFVKVYTGQLVLKTNGQEVPLCSLEGFVPVSRHTVGLTKDWPPKLIAQRIVKQADVKRILPQPLVLGNMAFRPGKTIHQALSKLSTNQTAMMVDLPRHTLASVYVADKNQLLGLFCSNKGSANEIAQRMARVLLEDPNEDKNGRLPQLGSSKVAAKPFSEAAGSNPLSEANGSTEPGLAASEEASSGSSIDESVTRKLAAKATALAALGQADYVERAGGCLKDLQLADGDDWVIELRFYANGTASDLMPRSLKVPRFRLMAPAEVVMYLLDHCDRVTLWIFTWDLVRSPEEYFEGMCEYLQRPQLEALANVIRSMALGTLRLKALDLREEVEKAKEGYEKAKLKLLPAMQLSQLRHWLVKAVAETPARIDLAKLVSKEASMFKGVRYAEALPMVHQHFQEFGFFSLDPFNDEVVGEYATWLTRMAREALSTAMPDLNGMDEESRAWVRRHATLRGKEVKALSQVLHEVTGGWDKLLVGSEPKLHFIEVDRSKLNVPVIMKWIRTRLLEPGRLGNDVARLIEYKLTKQDVVKELHGEELQRNLEERLGRKGVLLMEMLWAAFLDAQEQPDGIPSCVKAAAEQAAEELLATEGSEASKKRRSKNKRKKTAASKTSSAEEGPLILQLPAVDSDVTVASEVSKSSKEAASESTTQPESIQPEALAVAQEGADSVANSRPPSSRIQRETDGIPSSIKQADEAAAKPIVNEESARAAETRSKARRRRKKKAAAAAGEGPASKPSVDPQPSVRSSEENGPIEGSDTLESKLAPNLVAPNLEAKGLHFDNEEEREGLNTKELPRVVDEELPRATNSLARPGLNIEADVAEEEECMPETSSADSRKEECLAPLQREESAKPLEVGGISAGKSAEGDLAPSSQSPESVHQCAAEVGQPPSTCLRVPARARTPYNPLARANSSSSPARTYPSVRAFVNVKAGSSRNPIVARELESGGGDFGRSPSAWANPSVLATEDLLKLLSLSEAEHVPAQSSTRSEEEPAEPNVQRSFELKTLPPIAAVLLPSEISHVPRSMSVGSSPPSLSEAVRNERGLGGRANAFGDGKTAPVQEEVKRTLKVERKGTSDKLEEDTSCCICFERPRNAGLVPCGHMLCFECCELIKSKTGECPLCSRHIEGILKLHVP